MTDTQDRSGAADELEDWFQRWKFLLQVPGERECAQDLIDSLRQDLTPEHGAGGEPST